MFPSGPCEIKCKHGTVEFHNMYHVKDKEKNMTAGLIVHLDSDNTI